MSRPVGETPYLPNAGRAFDIPGLNAFDQDLTKALFFNLSELARRANATLPKDGQEPMTGNLDMGGFNISNALTLRLTSTGDVTLTSTDHALQIGASTGPNMVADTNEIQARNNGAASSLVLNAEGGVVAFHTFGADRIDINGGQLRFPATQIPSTGANDLDDYEEGTWTPTATFATLGNLTVVYSVRHAHYLKVGRQVTVWFGFTTSTFTHTTAAGEFRLTGLPFTALDTDSTFQWSGAVEIGPLTLGGGHTWVNSNMVDNANYIRFVASGTGLSRASLNTTHLPTGTNITMYGSITYEATQ